MTRTLLKRAVLPAVALFTLLVLLIHAQPYDDSDLRAFLLPANDCAAPCFMGIRPGSTGGDRAIRLLEEHPWVNGAVQEVNLRGRGVCLSWKWSDQQPSWIDSDGNDPCIRVQDGYVVQVIIPTTITYGDLFLLLGSPQRYTLGREIHPRRGMIHRSLYYAQVAGRIWFQMPCPVEALSFWNTHAEIEIFPRTALDATNEDLPLWWRFCYA